MTDTDNTKRGPSGSVPASGPATGCAAAQESQKPQPKKPEPAAKSAASSATPKDGKNSSGARPFVALLVVLVVLGLAWASWPFWGTKLPEGIRTVLAPVMNIGRQAAGDERLAALETRIASLEKSLAGIRTAVEETRAADAAKRADEIARIDEKIRSVGETAPLARQLGELEQRFAGLAAAQRAAASVAAKPADGAGPGPQIAALAAAGQQTASKIATLEAANTNLRNLLDSLGQRLAALETRPAPVATGPGPANALLLAIGQLREAVRGTGSYEPALQSVAALAGTDETFAGPLAALAAHRAGAADLPALRQQFTQAANAIVRATVVPRGEGWLDRTLDGLASLVSIRKTGDKAAAGDDVQGLVARAELRLATGDLAGAVKALEALKGAPADAAKPFLAAARARLAVDGAVDALMRSALVRAKS